MCCCPAAKHFSLCGTINVWTELSRHKNAALTVFVSCSFLMHICYMQADKIRWDIFNNIDPQIYWIYFFFSEPNCENAKLTEIYCKVTQTTQVTRWHMVAMVVSKSIPINRKKKFKSLHKCKLIAIKLIMILCCSLRMAESSTGLNYSLMQQWASRLAISGSNYSCQRLWLIAFVYSV